LSSRGTRLPRASFVIGNQATDTDWLTGVDVEYAREYDSELEYILAQ